MKKKKLHNYKGSEVFFSSDEHWSHAKIISHCPQSRGHFANVDEMNEAIVANWNATVPKDGVGFLLGDISFDKDLEKTLWYISRLNGREKHLVRGNHDDHITDEEWLRVFTTVSPLTEIMADDIRITLCHFPMAAWNQSHRGSWNLHGHSHGKRPESLEILQIDVGVDTNGMFPYTFAEIKDRMIKKKFVQPY